MRNPANRSLALAAAALPLLGAAARAEQVWTYDRGALKASLQAAAPSSQAQAAIVSRQLATQSLEALRAQGPEASPDPMRIAALGRAGEDRS